MNEEILSKICELIEVCKTLCAIVAPSLLICLCSVAGSAIYDLVTSHDEHKKIKEARSWKGRGKYPPLIDGKPWLQSDDEEEESKDE